MFGFCLFFPFTSLFSALLPTVGSRSSNTKRGCRVLILDKTLSIILPVPLIIRSELPSATSRLRGRARFPRYKTHNTVIILSKYKPPNGLHPVRSSTLAGKITPRSSYQSCLDLSTLQIASVPHTPNGAAVDPSGASESEGQTFTAPTSRSLSPDTPSFHSDSQRLVSRRKRVSQKARGVLGKVRAFQRIAAAKMAHPTIKIDTSVQATKRSHPDNEEGAEMIDGPEDDNPGLEEGDNEFVPPFLRQSVHDIHNKFEELEWMQRTRIMEGSQTNDPAHRWALDNDPEVRARNRYANVQAWANSRIHLRVPEGECDFINASPITLKDSVSQEERKYIATQGPKLDGLYHFWHMVFHETEEVAVIVMLTQAIEAGREKCAQYFPLDLESPSIFLREDDSDPFVEGDENQSENREILGQITLLESEWSPACRSEVRKLQLTLGSESKTVWHFLFAGWADYSKPMGEDRDALLQLIGSTASKAASPQNPRIVHCSAGVGRTGTFIALDHLLQELESGELLKATDEESDPVFETVDQMREQRMMMVYNEMQLIFIYEVLREQTDLILEKTYGISHQQSGARSAKIAKLSDEDYYLPASKPELEVAEEHPTAASPEKPDDE
ncbi:tyrosine protein phosphatase PTP1 [Aspergillus undulatus]|uniref:tyrosine protein phosphatase PTP1 n=1 Tax=Aspergillus undulatus TaxID=1810928 RepID=UPI003CCD28EF